MDELERAVAVAEPSRVVAAADRLLQSNPGHAVALQCKVVALVHNGSFELALEAAKAAPSLCKYEQAYCLFRLTRYEEALQLLQTMDLSNPQEAFREIELLAQTLYRMERFSDSMDAYKQLVNLQHDEFTVERSTNIMAVQAAAALSRQPLKATSLVQPTTFEQSYNMACLEIAQGNYDAAIARLDTAQKQCREVLQEDPDITDEELESELALLRVQQSVAYQLSGREEQAAPTLTALIRKRPDDPTLLAVVSNNLVALNRDKDLFDSKKKMKNTNAPEAEKRLSEFQRRVFDMNHCLLLLLTNQTTACRSMCTQLKEKYPDSDVPTLILAALHIRGLGKKGTEEERLNLIRQTLGDGKLGKLVSAQLMVSCNDMAKAAETLETVSEVRHQPAVVGYLVAVYNKLGRATDAERVLAESVQHWQTHAKNEEELRLKAHLLKACGDLELEHGRHEAAVRHFGELVGENPEEGRALASLIIALSHVDIAKAEQYAQQLPSITEGSNEPLDVDELEQGKAIRNAKTRKSTINFAKLASAPPTGSGSGAAAAGAAAPGASEGEGGAAAAAGAAVAKKRRKRKHKVRLPKNYNPNVAPDPERWLPKWQRTGYASKRKRKQSGVGKGTQGSANISQAEAAALDASQRPTIVKETAKKPTSGKANRKGGKRR